MRLALALMVAFCALFSYAEAPALTEDQKIEQLLIFVDKSNITFIRNGSEYSSADAARHIRSKLKSAKSSWFAPDKSKWTAKLFIEKVASKSSMSGKPYLVKLPDGQKLEAGVWLSKQLEVISSR